MWVLCIILELFSALISSWGVKGKWQVFPFSFLRHTVNAGESGQCLFKLPQADSLCRFTVTSVLFSMYYIDSKLTLNCNRRVHDLLISTLTLCACVRERERKARGKILSEYTDILHFEDIISANAPSRWPLFSYKLHTECVLKIMRLTIGPLKNKK